MPRRLLRTAFAAAVLASLIWAPAALADTFTPESGGVPERRRHRHALQAHALHRDRDLPARRGVLIWSLVKYRARRDGAAQPDPRQHAARDRLDDRRRVDPGRAHGRDLPLPRRHREPARLRPERPPAPSRGQFASIDQPAPPKTGGPTLTIHVNGQQYIWRYDYPGAQQLFSYAEMVVPTDTTVVAQDRGVRRDPLLVDPEVRPQGRRRARPRERDLVQGAGGQGGRLPRPVRRAVRAEPRRHARAWCGP